MAGAFGCQAILGIDSTTFDESQDAGGDANSQTDAAPNDAPNSGDSPSSVASITLSPTSLRLTPGSSADVTVTLLRAGVTGNVTVDVDGLDGGVTSAPIVIADETTSGSLHFTAAANAPFGGLIAQVRTSVASIAPVSLPIVVPGPSGTIDTSFASGEAAFTPGDAGTTASAVAVAVQSDSQVIVGVQPTGTTGWAIVRLDATGALDPTFNAAAAAIVPSDGALSDLVVGATDDIFAVGTSQNQLTVVHLLANGTRDPKFGTQGIARLDNVNFSSGSTGSGIAIQSDGRPIAVGARIEGADRPGLAVRFNNDGSRDVGFAGGGSQTLSIKQSLVKVAITSDDRIAGGGNDNTPSPPTLMTFHMSSGGDPDTAFSPSGIVDGISGPQSTNDIAIRPDAGYVLVGRDNSSVGLCAIAQFALAGDAGVDTTLGYPVANNASCTAVAVQTDGRFVVTGGGGGSFDHYGFLVRMISPSTLDSTFGDAGAGVVYYADHSIPSSVPYRFLYDVAIGPDGRIVAAGNQVGAGVFVIRVWP
jgi:uncharacterized delta-60 repeat protein